MNGAVDSELLADPSAKEAGFAVESSDNSSFTFIENGG